MSIDSIHAPSVEEFADRARSWLAERLDPVDEANETWGEGSDDVSVFHRLSFEEERGLLGRLMAWQQEKFDAGFGAITWPREYGGAGLSAEHEQAYR